MLRINVFLCSAQSVSASPLHSSKYVLNLLYTTVSSLILFALVIEKIILFFTLILVMSGEGQ